MTTYGPGRVARGAAVVAAMLTLATACGAADADMQAEADSPEAVATRFWDYALADQCIRSAAQMWWPVAVDDRRNEYVGTCERLSAEIESVDVGKAGPSQLSEVPYGASDLATVPVTVELTSGRTVEQDLTLVRVDRRWFVTR